MNERQQIADSGYRLTFLPASLRDQLELVSSLKPEQFTRKWGLPSFPRAYWSLPLETHFNLP